MDTSIALSLDCPRGGSGRRRWAHALWLAAVLIGVGTVTSPMHAASAASGGSWAPVGQLSVARSETTVTLLADAKVLVAGGGNPPEASVEVFDPGTLAWGPTGPMGTARVAHAAVRLADGRVVVSGGRTGAEVVSSAEVFDPATGTWAPTGAMAVPRQAHTATLLADGKVLVVGGLGGGHGPHRAEAELFDPATATWAPTGAMPQARAHHAATLLSDGRVLVVGGEGAPHDASLRDAAVYDPAAGTWAVLPRLMATGRSDHTATALPDGTVVVAGGTKLHTAGRPQNILSSAELLDRATSAFLPAPAMAQRRSSHAATAVSGGRVLVVGGFGERIAEPIASAELYDPFERRWATMAPMPEPAAHHAVVVVSGSACAAACDKVLVVGERATYLYTPPPPGSAGSQTDTGTGLVIGAVGAGAALVVMVGVIVARRRRHVGQPGNQTLSRRGTNTTMEHR